jgi:tetratricopeptide (TPR) repeat protein
MSRPDDSPQFNPLGGELPDDVVSPLRDQSQLDFDIAFYGHILERAALYVDVLRCQGELLTRKGLHQQALQIDRRLVELLPDDEVVHYNLACSLALAGDTPDALNALRSALERGYDDFDYLLADADLNSLREEPEYQALLREYHHPDLADASDNPG